LHADMSHMQVSKS